MARLKPSRKLKTFFKNKEPSEVAVEVLKMFILPFVKFWDSRAALDDAIAAFFNTENRKIYRGKAKRNFAMPGYFLAAGNRLLRKGGHREIKKGQALLLVIDKVDQTAKVDVPFELAEHTFLLSRPEVEFLKDYVEITEV